MHKKSVDPENEEPRHTQGRDNQTAMGRLSWPGSLGRWRHALET